MATSGKRTGRPPGRQGVELLDTARTAFVEHGFDGATMNDIAARAGVSKASLYREHESKHALFVAVVTDWTSQGRGAMRPHLEELAGSAEVGDGLRTFAGVLADAILSAEVMAMRRLVASEARRFPEVAERYLETSWHANIAALADTLADMTEHGMLDVDDPPTAAEHLVWLTVGPALNAVTLGGRRPADTDHDVSAAVRTFLARYGR